MSASPRWLLVALAALLLSSCATAPRLYEGEGRELREALELYRQNRLEEARPILEQAVREHPEDADARAWLAEVLRRQEDFGAAFDQAALAVRLVPCHAFAHTVLGALHDPQFHGDPMHQDAQDAWDHYRLAVQCDPLDGNAWMSLWVGAILRGDTTLEWEALGQMDVAEFWPSPLMAHSRWLLEDLPEGAILLTNGDADTYPLAILQVDEDLRPDVALVNLSLLNLAGYAEAMAQRHGLTLPAGERQAYMDAEGQVVTPARTILRHWIQQVAAGTLDRPLLLAITVDRTTYPEPWDIGATLVGSAWLLMPGAPSGSVDVDVVWGSLRRLDPRDFQGDYASAWDRSCVRQANSHHLAGNPLAAALQAGSVAMKTGRRDVACELADWADRYLRRVHPPGSFEEGIRRLREVCAGDEAGEP